MNNLFNISSSRNSINNLPPEQLARKISWAHGTNSSILPMLPATEHQLISSGRLLERVIAPMSGEIRLGGMCPSGINQNFLSGCRAQNILKSLKYATQTSHSFHPEKLDFQAEFQRCLRELGEISPESEGWDPLLIQLLRLKQWSPKEFQKLCLEKQEAIQLMKERTLQQGPSKQVLEAFDYPIEELEKAKTDLEVREKIDNLFLSSYKDFPQNHWSLERKGMLVYEYKKLFFSPDRIGSCYIDDQLFIKAIFRIRLYGDSSLEELRKKAPSSVHKNNLASLLFQGNFRRTFLTSQQVLEGLREKIKNYVEAQYFRYERMLQVFDNQPPKVCLEAEESRFFVTHPFPLLFATTQCLAKDDSTLECHIERATLGKNLDLLFAPSEHMTEVGNWLEMHKLQDKVALYSLDLIPEIDRIAKTPSKSCLSSLFS